MKSPQDLVWDTITNSAKRKFDYTEYRSALGSMADDIIADNIIFIIIAGHAANKSDEQIAAIINNELALLAIQFPTSDLLEFLRKKKTEFKEEIHAAEVALALFERGAEGPGVIVQVKSMLKMF